MFLKRASLFLIISFVLNFSCTVFSMSYISSWWYGNTNKSKVQKNKNVKKKKVDNFNISTKKIRTKTMQKKERKDVPDYLLESIEKIEDCIKNGEDPNVFDLFNLFESDYDYDEFNSDSLENFFINRIVRYIARIFFKDCKNYQTLTELLRDVFLKKISNEDILDMELFKFVCERIFSSGKSEELLEDILMAFFKGNVKLGGVFKFFIDQVLNKQESFEVAFCKCQEEFSEVLLAGFSNPDLSKIICAGCGSKLSLDKSYEWFKSLLCLDDLCCSYTCFKKCYDDVIKQQKKRKFCEEETKNMVKEKGYEKVFELIEKGLVSKKVLQNMQVQTEGLYKIETNVEKSFRDAGIQTDKKNLTAVETQTDNKSFNSYKSVQIQTNVRFVEDFLESHRKVLQKMVLNRKQDVNDIFALVDFLSFNSEETKKQELDFLQYLAEVVDDFISENIKNILEVESIDDNSKERSRKLLDCKSKIKELIKELMRLAVERLKIQSKQKKAKILVDAETQCVQPEEEYKKAFFRINRNAVLKLEQNIHDIFTVVEFWSITPKECDKQTIKSFAYLQGIVVRYFEKNLKEVLYSEELDEDIREHGKKLLLCKNRLQQLIKNKQEQEQEDSLFEATNYYTCINDLPDNLVEPVLKRVPEMNDIVIIRKKIQSINKKKQGKTERKKDRFKFIILKGPNGTGKSSVGKAVAKALKIKYHCFNCPDIQTKYQKSESERITDKTNAIIDEGKPCVIVFDEADALMPSKKEYENVDEAPVNKTIGIFVNKVVEKNLDFILIFTTNHPKKLSTTIRDRTTGGVIEVPLPNEKARKEAIKYYIKKAETGDLLGLGKDKSGKTKYDYDFLDYNEIVKSTKNFSFRQLRDLVYQVEYDCAIEIAKANEDSKNERIIFTNKRFKKFYNVIREKNYPKESLWGKCCSINKEYGIIKNFVSGFAGGLGGGLGGGLAGMAISGLHNRYRRTPQLQERDLLLRKLDKNYGIQQRKIFKPKMKRPSGGGWFSGNIVDPEWQKDYDRYQKIRYTH